MEKKLAVLFPGVGYHVDKPLLYYAKDVAASLGYEYIELKYDEAICNIGKDKKKLQEAFKDARENVGRQLSQVDFGQYASVCFISKSYGSILAAEYAYSRSLNVKQVIFTPIYEIMEYPIQNSIVFHGTKDEWIPNELLEKKCEQDGAALYMIEDANHSLETEDTLQNIRNLYMMIEVVKTYIN